MTAAGISLLGLLSACSSGENGLAELPQIDNFCVDAQRVITRTQYPVELVVHDDFDAFVKSKALIDGPTIQQYNWPDAAGSVAAVSCKLKSADHLNLAFGEGTAGPDGACQDMNQAIFMLIARDVTEPAYNRVTFDPNETVRNDEVPGMTGPDWLAPYTATQPGQEGELVIRSKGFIVNFSDPQFAEAPERFRGVHYCHLLAPDYMRGLLDGSIEPGLQIGRNPGDMGRGY
jgi:hypothetical protein